MICLYEKNANVYIGDQATNGLCVLDPSVCTVTEKAGGSYELHLEHPMDEEGKYLLLAEDRLIQAPVPKITTPTFTLPNTKIWRTKRQTKLYSKLPVYKKPPGSVSAKKYNTVISNISDYLYDNTKLYTAGSDVVIERSGHYLYYTTKKSAIGVEPGMDYELYNYEGDLGSSGGGGSSPTEDPTYKPGVVAETLAQGVSVTFVADISAVHIKVKHGDNVGYVARADVEETETSTSGETITGRTITKQLFRIYSVQSEDDTHTVVVDAKHISYDFAGNALYECKVTDAEPMAAIANIQSALMEPDDLRIIACNITSGKVTGDWSYKNPINALLDPDSGVVGKLKARLVRDNTSFYILDNSTPNTGITLDYGVNMLGVNWSRNAENVITRVMPRCKDGKNGYVYLDHGGTWSDAAMSTWVQSDNLFVEAYNAANRFPVPRFEVLNCNYQVGKEFVKPDGEKIKMTEDSCKAQMLEDAQNRFLKDGADQAEITLDVQFVLLGDTEEYKQYKNLQNVCLYDEVTVNTGDSYLRGTKAKVTEYEYDAILERYNSVRLGEVTSFRRRVSGYRLIDNSIDISKLSPDLVEQILTSGDSNSSDSGSSSGGGSGSGYAYNPMNSKTVDGMVAKGQGNANKVWGTDSEGNPGWVAGGGFDPNNLSESSNDPTDNDYTMQIGSTSYKLKFSRVWNYIKSKISSVLGLTENNYSGKAATAGDADTVNGKTVGTNVPADAVFTDTKNTAGSTNSTSKLFLIGAKSQAANPQTYSRERVFIKATDNSVVADQFEARHNSTTKAKMYIDGSGGGVLMFADPNNHSFVFDTVDNKYLRMYCFDDDDNIKNFYFDRTNGEMKADYFMAANLYSGNYNLENIGGRVGTVEGKVTTLEGKINSKIKTKSVTKTTSAAGNFDSGLAASSNLILGVKGNGGSDIYIPYAASGGNWWVHVTSDNSTMTARSSVSKTVKIYYMEI